MWPKAFGVQAVAFWRSLVIQNQQSALSLLVLGVLADDHDLAFSLDDLALFADLLYGWFNLHYIIPYLS